MGSRRKDVEVIKDTFNKFFTGDPIKLASDEEFIVKYILTGVLPIDQLLGGGIPRGRATEIFGDYSTLKSYIGYSAIAQVQQAGGIAALIDTEHAYDPIWAAAIGVDNDELIVRRPPNGERAVDETEFLIRKGVDLIVWDSVASTLPKAEQEKSMEEGQTRAPLAHLMSAAMRKLTAANSNTALLFINQVREKPGIAYGSPEYAPGGRTLPFYATYRIAISKSDTERQTIQVFDGKKLRNTRVVVGQKIRAYLLKSKLNSPFRDVYFDWLYEEGQIDELGYLITWGYEDGYIKKRGDKWSVGASTKTSHGITNFRKYLTANPDVLEKVRTRCLGSLDPALSKEDLLNDESFESEAPSSTPTPVRGRSKKTAATPKPTSRATSTKSRTRPASRSRSVRKRS